MSLTKRARAMADGWRTMMAGAAAMATAPAAEALFHAGGKHVLSQPARDIVRSALERGSVQLIERGAPGMLARSPLGAAPALGVATAARVARSGLAVVGRQGGRSLARVAAVQVAGSMGRAAGVGLLIDGGAAAIEATMGVRAGAITKNEAIRHVATEAGTGALASAVGVGAAAAAIALTGGLAAPAVFAIGAGGAIVAKLGLRAVFSPRLRTA
jgi:hypothetical protein